jgi:hypothetical protein
MIKALVVDLNPWICLSLFLIYGVFFEMLYVKYLACLSLFLIYGVFFEMLYVKYLAYFRDFKRIPAANVGTLLFLLSLWGLGEAIKNNIMYAIPIAFGTWLGTFIQISIEKRKSEKDSEGDG